MFSVLGVDISSHAVDLVALDENSDRAEWTRLPLAGKTPFERCRAVSAAMPQPGWFVDRGVFLVAVERPRSGFYKSLAAQLPVFGAVVAALSDTIPETTMLWELAPKEWRAAIGLSGNASKEEVVQWAAARWFPASVPLETVRSQDAWDSFCIAYAARTLNERAITRKVALA